MQLENMEKANITAQEKVERIQKACAKARAKAQARWDKHAKDGKKRPSSQPPAEKMEHFDIGDKIQEEDSFETGHEDADYEDHSDEDYDYAYEEGRTYDDEIGWSYEDPEPQKVRTSQLQDLNEEEEFLYARQTEADEIWFDNWPQPGKTMDWCISVIEKVMTSSIVPERACCWMKEAEEPDLKSWKELEDDPAYLVKFNQKFAAGFMELVRRRAEFSTRARLVKMDLYKVGEPLSGRVLYRMILNELRTSRNTIGMMNINDLNRVNNRGRETHHLRNFQSHWDKCLSNFRKLPDEETLQPLYEVQVVECDASKQHYACYEMSHCAENEEKSYEKGDPNPNSRRALSGDRESSPAPKITIIELSL